MYSKNARWQNVVQLEAPRTLLIEIAERHKKWHGLQTVDYYYAPELGLMAVTEDPACGGWHKNVDDWKWESMIQIL